MARVAGTLYFSGFVLTVLCIFLPHSPQADIRGFWIMAAAVAVAGALLLVWGDRLPAHAFEPIMLLASATITLSLWLGGERHGGHSAGNQVLYLWVALYAGYFFTRARIVVQLVVLAALYAAVLVAIHPGEVGPTRWLITVGMVSLVAFLVHELRRRNDGLLERLELAARTDPLTGLANRQTFDERLELELARGRRTSEPTAVIYADVDCFKQINDVCGHQAGDMVLRAVAERFDGLARGLDTVARVGGDEFAAILPNSDARRAHAVAERLRAAVSAIESPAIDRVTMSFGVAACDQPAQTAEQLVRSADDALYRAKKLGRDRAVKAAPPQARTSDQAARG